MKTVYIIVEGGMITDIGSKAKDVEIVVLDRDTQDEEMLKAVDAEIAKISELPEVEIF